MPSVKLTKAVIDSLEPTVKDQVYWDRELHGLGLKVTPTGRKVYIVMYRTTGSQRRLRKYTLGTHGVLTLVSARTAAQKILLARLDGQDPAAEKQVRRRGTTGLAIEEVIGRYRSEYLVPREIGSETIRILERIVLPEWRGRQLPSISRTNVRDCIDAIAQRGAPAMAGRAFKVIRAFFVWCIGRGLIETTPCAGLQPPPAGHPRDRVLNDEELARVLMAASVMPTPFGPIVTMLALTGQRRSEVANMRWEELDLEKKTWTIPARRTKTRRSHVVHLTPQMISVLPDREADEPLVYPSLCGTTFKAFSNLKKTLNKRSGVQDWVLHDLRRTAATGMAALGVAPHVADKILNHQSGTISGIVAVYQRHEFMAERKAATELWSRHVETIFSKVKLSTPVPHHREGALVDLGEKGAAILGQTTNVG